MPPGNINFHCLTILRDFAASWTKSFSSSCWSPARCSSCRSLPSFSPARHAARRMNSGVTSEFFARRTHVSQNVSTAWNANPGRPRLQQRLQPRSTRSSHRLLLLPRSSVRMRRSQNLSSPLLWSHNQRLRRFRLHNRSPKRPSPFIVQTSARQRNPNSSRNLLRASISSNSWVRSSSLGSAVSRCSSASSSS